MFLSLKLKITVMSWKNKSCILQRIDFHIFCEGIEYFIGWFLSTISHLNIFIIFSCFKLIIIFYFFLKKQILFIQALIFKYWLCILFIRFFHVFYFLWYLLNYVFHRNYFIYVWTKFLLVKFFKIYNNLSIKFLSVYYEWN